MLRILEQVAQSPEPLHSIELAQRIDAPRATTHRLCTLLQHLGFLEREIGGKRFVLGSRQIALALRTLSDAAHCSERHALLQALAREANETVNIAVLEGNEAVYVDRVECQWPLRHHMSVGTRVPIHCSASGKLFLALLPAAERRKRLAAPLQPYTGKSITDSCALQQQLRRIRSLGVSVNDEEYIQGMIGIAVPVRDRRGRICATVSLNAPTARSSPKQILDYVPALRRTAEAIEATLPAADSRPA